jgi:hypothetical protein
LIGAAVKSSLYMGVYNSLIKNNQVPFEIIFIGYNPPTEKLPDNFQYIYSEVKPAQCIEAAARLAKGDFLVNIADDEIFSYNFLNNLKSYIDRVNTDKMFFAFRYKVRGKIRDDRLWYEKNRYGKLMCGVACCVEKRIWHEVGGIDKRFAGSLYDLDLQFRYLERGMKLFITPRCIIEELHDQGDSQIPSLFDKTNAQSRRLLKKFWSHSDESVVLKRLCEVDRFADDNILSCDQLE